MSEGDPGESSGNVKNLKSRDQEDSDLHHHHHKVLTPTLSSSPPRSRSQSAGSTHREALLFFERHKLFQSEPEEKSLELPGIITEDTTKDPFHFNSGKDQESSEISTFSKSPSPAHYSDAQSSSDDQQQQHRNFTCVYSGNTLYIPQPRERSKSDNLTLLVRQESKKKEQFGDESLQLFGKDQRASGLHTSGRDNDSANNSDKSPQRNRSIRGRSHSQPSQVIVTCVSGGGGFNVDQRRGEGPGGESYSGESRKGSKKYSWLEQIQFRAQYQHFRTNDYASVVNSASSLDKAGVPINDGTATAQAGRAFQVGRGKSQQTHPLEPGTVVGSQQTSPSIGATTLSSEPRNSCWNFPKVKFRRIFNAKSLDDILSRSHPTSSNSSKSSSYVSPEIPFPSERSSSTSAKNNTTPCKGDFSGAGSTTSDLLVNEDGTSSSFIPPNKTKRSISSLSSLKIYNPNPTNLSQGLTSVSVSSSGSIGSGSESGGGGNKSKGKSLVSSVFQRIPHFHSSGNKDSTCTTSSRSTSTSDGNTTKKSRKKGSSSSSSSSGGENKPSKSLSSGSLNRVSAAKSDNYLNRIVVSATCAKFTVRKSTDNLATATTTSQSDTHKSTKSAIKNKKKQGSGGSCTLVEAFSIEASAGGAGKSSVEISNQPQQRRWTAVKQKWDLKLQQSQVPLGAADASNSNSSGAEAAAVFIKSQLSQISGVPSSSSFQHGTFEQDNPNSSTQFLESCGTTASNNSLQDASTQYIPTKPHEAGRVKFCLEPQEIPCSPTISRSQSSDCRPIQVDPSLIGIIDSSQTSAEEESEEMTKSRHFHYSTNVGGSGSGSGSGASKLRSGMRQPAIKDLQEPSSSSSGGGGTFQLTSKDIKAQLVVANLSYLQRPTSPCLLVSSPAGESSSSINPSSPVVFSSSPNNNCVSGATAAGVTSPLSSSYHQTRMMKHEYLTSGSGSIAFLPSGTGNGSGANRSNNLNDRQIKENINKGPGGYSSSSSSFVIPSCVNRNDVISSPPSQSRLHYNDPSGANKMVRSKESQYGSDRVGQEQDYRDDDDTFVYTNRYKEDYTHVSTGNKNVTSSRLLDQQRQPSGFHVGDVAEDQLHSGDFSFDSGCSNMSGDYVGFDNRAPLTSINLVRDLQQDLPQKSSLQGNNNFQLQDSSEEQEDEMADLQSPTYVKRTAHMFNSKYSSQLNGSSSPGDPIKENRNPSYLNVSRSVSGYSCLSYNNGVTTNSTTTTNGSSTCTNGTSPYSHKYVSPTSTKVKSEFTIKVNQPQVRHHHHRMNEDDNDTMNNGDGRLIRSPTSPKSKYHADESEETSEVDGTYVPSHGKSFIMQRIERLYGSEAVQSASVFSKNSVSKGGSTTTTTLKCETVLYSPSKGKERVIPIQIENDFEKRAEDEVDRSVGSEKVAKERGGYERLIRGDEMLTTSKSLEKEEIQSHENDGRGSPSRSMKSVQILTDSSCGNVNSSSLVANKFENGSDGIDTMVFHEGVSLESCPGTHRLHTISLDAGDKQMLLTSAKIKNGIHSHDDSRPLTSPSPTKKSQPLYDDDDAASLDVISSVVDVKTDKVDNEESKPVVTSVTDELLTANSSVNESSIPPTMPSTREVIKNGTYFLNEMNLTKKRLAEYTEKFGKEVEEIDESSERAGNILSAVGKANLLMKKKFKQFEELCNLNLKEEVGDQPVTTNEDLGGFWDMVMIQVEQVYALFQKLEGIEPENSKDVPDKSKAKAGGSPRKSASTKGANKPVVSKSQSSEAAKARDESRRKMLAEKRRMMKNQAQGEASTTDQEAVVIFTPETN